MKFPLVTRARYDRVRKALRRSMAEQKRLRQLLELRYEEKVLVETAVETAEQEHSVNPVTGQLSIAALRSMAQKAANERAFARKG